MVFRIVFLTFILLILVGCAGQETPAPTQTIEAEIGAVAEVTSPADLSPTIAPLPTDTSVPLPPPTETAPAASTETASPTAIPAIATEPAIQCSGVPTPANPEGPFYTPNTPERSNLIEEGMGGEPVLVRGRVVTTDCEPIAGAVVDFWQTDAAGEYDNVGYRLRGHQFTGEDGGYNLETIIPGEYPGRTAHIHVKLFAPDGTELLTTQLYIPGVSEQVPDGIGAFILELLAQDVSSEDGRRHVIFDFVVPAG